MKAPKLTKLELQILEALWAHGKASIREIQEAFPEPRPAYTTIQTTVYRLEGKKAVRRVRKISNAHIFEPVVARDITRHRLLDEILSFFGGRALPMVAQLAEAGKLTRDDIRELERREGSRRPAHVRERRNVKMIGAFSNHLWQSTVFVLAVAVLARLLRRNRAGVRHGLWLAASLKFLVPFSLLMSAGSWLAPSARAYHAAPTVATAVSQVTEPFPEVLSIAPARAAPRTAMNWTSALVAVWAAGFAAIAIVRWRSWRRVRTALRASVPVTMPGVGVPVRSTAGLLEPGVVGFWRPVLLIPAGIEDYLTRLQLDAVLAHEVHHVHRRDNLTAALHMIVKAGFWFHPLVWWIGVRLIDERERACDEYVLRVCGTPQAYAEGILNICRRYVESPLSCVPGVTGSDLKQRLEAIMINRIGLRLNRARQAVLACAVAITLALPMAIGAITVPLRAQSSLPSANAPATNQTFDVASVKPCEPGPLPPGARGGGGGSGSFSPGRTHLDCFVVKNLIDQAYVANRASKDPNDVLNAWPGLGLAEAYDGLQRIRGGPAWVYSDKYTIEARMPGVPSPDQGPRSPDRALMLGPMLRALLENRFQLKVHMESEDVPMFALTVAKGGLKITPMKDGDCTMDRLKTPVLVSEAARRGVKPTCGTVHSGPDGPNWLTEHGGQDLGVVAMMLSSDLGVKVVDRTGVTDKFNIVWEYGPDENTPGSMRWLTRLGPQPPVPPTAPSIFTALEQQLGLKLVPIKGSRGYLVIDHIERPTPDGPASGAPANRLAQPPARATGAGPVSRR